MIKRVFYAASGASDLIALHRSWEADIHHPFEVAINFPSLIHDFCRDIGAKGYFVSVHPNVQRVEHGDFILEHRPKRSAKRLAYHLEELRYGLSLLRTARSFRADVALLDSGSTHYFWMGLFRRSGIAVVPILHNTLWPSGFRPNDFHQRILQTLNKPFWKRTPIAGIAVSPEVERQVSELAPGHGTPFFQTRAQYHADYFRSIPRPPPHDQRPFQVMFTGRVDREKGALDIPLMARRLEDRQPGAVKWVVLGNGRHLAEFKRAVSEQRVGHVVELRTWTSRDDLRAAYAASHACIVPTLGSFSEGLAMTAAEAVLAGRPLVTNPVVPASELVRAAVQLARTNDPDSHADAVWELATNAELYERLRSRAPYVQAPFYDRSLGLRAVLHRALAPLIGSSGRSPAPQAGIVSGD